MDNSKKKAIESRRSFIKGSAAVVALTFLKPGDLLAGEYDPKKIVFEDCLGRKKYTLYDLYSPRESTIFVVAPSIKAGRKMEDLFSALGPTFEAYKAVVYKLLLFDQISAHFAKREIKKKMKDHPEQIPFVLLDVGKKTLGTVFKFNNENVPQILVMNKKGRITYLESPPIDETKLKKALV